ncbi:hypothetical protein KAI58_00850 [Candidatus Gracilibacteria bacterium]|nr:hypothetical protein [Candidatus Gracilibacteria bacterium]
MSKSKNSLIRKFQKLYEKEYGRAVSESEAERILSSLGDLLLLAGVDERENPP